MRIYVTSSAPGKAEQGSNIQLVNHTLIEEADFCFCFFVCVCVCVCVSFEKLLSIFNVGPAQLSAALSEEPGKRNSFSFTGPQAAAEQNSNKISPIMLCLLILSPFTGHTQA